MVRMWPGAPMLRWLTIAASVVDLPEPVAPTIRIRPRLCMTISPRMGGRLSSSMVGISEGMRRSTMETVPRWRNTFTRKRAEPSSSAIAKSHSLVLSNSARCASLMTA